MKTNALFIGFFILLGTLIMSGQKMNIYEPKAFKLMDYRGNINVSGQAFSSFYEGQDQEHYGYRYGLGGFLGTKSYIYHPNFLTLNRHLS